MVSVYVCMYVCMNLCMNLCMNMCMYVCMYDMGASPFVIGPDQFVCVFVMGRPLRSTANSFIF